jgi:hypothetical protein
MHACSQTTTICLSARCSTLCLTRARRRRGRRGRRGCRLCGNGRAGWWVAAARCRGPQDSLSAFPTATPHSPHLIPTLVFSAHPDTPSMADLMPITPGRPQDICTTTDQACDKPACERGLPSRAHRGARETATPAHVTYNTQPHGHVRPVSLPHVAVLRRPPHWGPGCRVCRVY